jgi:non-lysosomal glucosylceramidase
MSKDGCPPMTLGKGLDLTGPYQYQYQNTLNPCCYVDLVDRLWLRTGDDGVLKEFYPAVKKTTQYMATLIPGENSIISTAGPEWYESMSIGGMSSHVGGIRLAHMQMAERMARKTGDAPFAGQCRKWFEQGKKGLEDRLWAGTHYLLSLDAASGSQSDLILAYQLDGEWLSDLHGLPGVFQKDRLDKTLRTIRTRCGDSRVTDGGLLNVVRPDGKVLDFGGRMGMYCSMPGSVFEAAMTYLYEGDRQTAMRITRDSLNLLVNVTGMTWDMPNMVHAEPGKTRRIYGFDYYQVWSLWGLPAALARQDIRASCAPGSLVDRVIRAGAEHAAHGQKRERQ